MIATDKSRILEGILDPVRRALNDDAARKLVGLKANRKVSAQVARLARKCNNGTLSPEERVEYEMYVLLGDVVAILQAQARIHIAEQVKTR